jgi:NADP-dependent 3-hydroxy acid dehydrogenase YdfG
MSLLKDKTVLVTGGGSGIGLAAARGFLQAGSKVCISGRDADKLRRAAGELGHADRLMTHAADVAEPAQVRTLIQAIVKKFGPIDVLVNNAGTNLKERTVRELKPETWQRLIRANLDGAFYCIHEVLPSMLERHSGVIVNVSSVAGKRANPLGGAAYVASKFGMSGLGLCLAAEEKDSGVRVSNVYPGEVDTPILEVRPKAVTVEQRQQILKPEDVAAAILFVAGLPPHVSVPELVIKPTAHVYF